MKIQTTRNIATVISTIFVYLVFT